MEAVGGPQLSIKFENVQRIISRFVFLNGYFQAVLWNSVNRSEILSEIHPHPTGDSSQEMELSFRFGRNGKNHGYYQIIGPPCALGDRFAYSAICCSSGNSFVNFESTHLKFQSGVKWIGLPQGVLKQNAEFRLESKWIGISAWSVYKPAQGGSSAQIHRCCQPFGHHVRDIFFILSRNRENKTAKSKAKNGC